MTLRGRILWVDDEIDLLRPHVLYLKEKGYQVQEVTNGLDAISSVRGTRFDLVLLDEMMPGLDGIATLREIKGIQPALPVVLITKNEEEWLMDEAISEKVAGYLTKPVNPSQIFMACKKVLEEDRILGEKTASGYLQDFQEIETTLSYDLEIEDWWKLHFKLAGWQLEMDERKDRGLGSILDEQVKSCNRKFAQFVSDHYQAWIHSAPQSRPTLSVDVLEKFVFSHLRRQEKVFFLVIDCFRLDQAMTLLPELQRYFDVEFDYHVSTLPSATPFCRNAIFSGWFLSEIQSKEPEMWKSMTAQEQGMNRFEGDLLATALRRSGLRDESFSYHKVNVAKEGKTFLNRLSEYMDTSLMALVVNFLDLLTHQRPQSEILQEMMPDETGYRSTVRTWFENSWLFDVLRTFSESAYKVILTSDHGSVRVQRGVRVAADRETSAGVRYKYGRNLNCPEKFALVVKQPRDYLLPEMVTGTNYLIAKEDNFFVYPTEYHRYLNLFQNSFQHGGISMDEMLVPTFTLTGK